MTQEKLRTDIRELHIKRGIPYTFIAKRLNISNSFISLWLKEERNFSQATMAKAIEYIKTERIMNDE